jgi:hypothetical protein
METKICSKCSENKSVYDFYKDNSKKDFLSSSCKLCVKLKTEKYLKENPQLIKLRKQIFYQKNKEQINQKNKVYRGENRDDLIKYSKKYYQENREQLLDNNKVRYFDRKDVYEETNKKYREKNKEKIKKYLIDYQKNNKDKLNQSNRLRKKERLKTDEIFKLKNNVSHRVRMYLKTKSIIKSDNTFNIVGCTPEFLKKHLEIQFIDGMSWENHGYYGWHIDHIIPLSSAKTEDEIYILCHYTNLQPLWAEDNLKKSNKIYSPFKSQM